MKNSVRTLKQRNSKLSPEDKKLLDIEGEEILASFAKNLANGVSYKDEHNADLLQKHFDWVKKFYSSNKIEYLAYTKNLADNQSSIIALNSIQEGLPAYIKSVAMFYIGKIS